ncbi:LysR family transcriptional regulator [Paeniglutamicibacter cryotolerans]|uniref:DNA-binding transcriptional LysR family regulator n=1 Tax=Paeniglutamicibacter cryotolerans TaxID=670079 RepID=A0A839QHA3_9MICC|nr:LysR family transcriptional regulator [Paeniglutamicibacter cryotolerans]MBB2995127.1 DNA-binding transcriptional LysR family regulator [Paeniglutamicibacter cryotolerans]
MLNLVHLRTLVEVLRLGSFTGAGNRLGYTASAVSQQMSALERETGIQLFVRSARSAHPTDSAHVVGQHALKLLRDADELLAAASATVHGSARELRIGVFPSAAMFILADVLESPDWKDLGIQLKITIGEPSTTVPRLRSGGELDMAIIYQVGESGLVLPQGVTRHWIGDDPYCVVVPTAWGMREGSRISTEELANRPWLLHHRGSSDATIIESTLANAELHPRVVATSDDFTATLRLIAAGHGMALVPRLTLATRPPGLTVVHVPELALSRKLIALRAEAAPVEAAREFLRMAGSLAQ